MWKDAQARYVCQIPMWYFRTLGIRTSIEVEVKISLTDLTN